MRAWQDGEVPALAEVVGVVAACVVVEVVLDVVRAVVLDACDPPPQPPARAALSIRQLMA